MRQCAQSCRELTDIALTGCVNVTDDVLEDLASSCDGLVAVDFGACAAIKDGKKIANFFRSLENVKKISLRQSGVSPSTLKEIFGHAPRLTEADLGKCVVELGAVGDLARIFARRCPCLTSLNLEQWGGGDRGFAPLAQVMTLTLTLTLILTLTLTLNPKP